MMHSNNKKNALSNSSSICPPPELELLDAINKNECDRIRTIIKTNKALLQYENPHTSKTYLCIACSNEATKPLIVESLLELGASIEGNAKWNPLHLAAINRNVNILKAILKNLKPGQINKLVEGRTALHTLVRSDEVKNNEEAFCAHVELLLKSGINANQGDSKNVSAILWAAKKGYRHVIKCILEKSVQHVDLDSHKLRNEESARDLIIKNGLYEGPLPERCIPQRGPDRIFALVKQAKQDELIAYLEATPNSHNYLNADDGTSTLLQYSCEKGLQKVVRYLLERKVDINAVTNSNKTKPVEIAARSGFYEIFQLLLDYPNVKITAELLCQVMKDCNEVKFGSSDREQCCKMLLRKLESNRNRESGINVNDVDNMKNTALHYSLRYGDKATTESLLKLGASLACKNQFGIMPIEDIRPELLKSHLDDCVKFCVKNKNEYNQHFKVSIDYSTLVPPRKFENNKTDCEKNMLPNNKNVLVPETEVIAFMSRSPEFKPLLKHPVVVSFLLMKWHKIRCLFYANLLFYILFVLSLFVYIFTYYSNFDRTSDLFVVLGQISCVVLNLTFWMLVLREIFQMTVSPKNYFYNFENYVEITLIFVTGIIVYASKDSNDLRRELSSVAILLAAFELLLMIGQHPRLSTMVAMFKAVSVNFFKLLLWYSLLIIAFALSFNILFGKSTSSIDNKNQTGTDDNKNVFMGPGASLFKTIVMLTGEFDAGSINFDTYPVVGKTIFTLFVFMITIILLNLLNGLAVSDTQTIKNDAELVGHITRAQHIFYVESMLLGNIFPRTLIVLFQSTLCCFANNRDVPFAPCNPLAKKVCLFTTQDLKLFVMPNNYGKISYEHKKIKLTKQFMCAQSCCETYLDIETVNRILDIVKMKRQFEDNTASDDMVSLRADISELKLKMEQILLKNS